MRPVRVTIAVETADDRPPRFPPEQLTFTCFGIKGQFIDPFEERSLVQDFYRLASRDQFNIECHGVRDVLITRGDEWSRWAEMRLTGQEA